MRSIVTGKVTEVLTTDKGTSSLIEVHSFDRWSWLRVPGVLAVGSKVIISVQATGESEAERPPDAASPDSPRPEVPCQEDF